MIARVVLSALVAAVFVLASCAAATSPVSSQDQYEPARPQAKPLHKVPLQSTGLNPISLLPGQGNKREKRQFINWYGSYQHQPQYGPPPAPVQTYSAFQAYVVPYFIPIWGQPARIPIFFPTKSIVFNPGYPARGEPTNKRPAPEEEPAEGPVTLGNRFKETDDQVAPTFEEDGNPIWGVVESDEPANSLRAPTTQAPARRPESGRTTPPPLFHRPQASKSATQSAASFAPERPIVPVTSGQQEAAPVNNRPPAAQPNRCVWAIVSCCRPSSQEVKHNCFEQLGCPGSFWDRNPCSRELTAAALKSVQEFYDQS